MVPKEGLDYRFDMLRDERQGPSTAGNPRWGDGLWDRLVAFWNLYGRVLLWRRDLSKVGDKTSVHDEALEEDQRRYNAFDGRCYPVFRARGHWSGFSRASQRDRT